MNDNVIDLPKQENPELDNFLFASLEPSLFKVCIEGRIIPRMTARQMGDKYEVHLDGRWCYIFDTKGDAYCAASMAANAMAIGEGYPWFGAPNKDAPFAPTVRMIDTPLPK